LKRVTQFIIVLGVAITGLFISLYAINLLYQEQSSSNFMPDMMNRMMGGMAGGMVSAPTVPFYLMILTPVFTLLLLLGLVGLIYFIVVPEIKVSSQVVPSRDSTVSTKALRSEKFSTVQSMMKPDEKKVLETLSSHGGKYLQKHISRETNLSRLKTHRIIAGFVQRGIVTVRPYGNTNEVSLSDWLLPEE
jgi:uncharacterized membrane protein